MSSQHLLVRGVARQARRARVYLPRQVHRNVRVISSTATRLATTTPVPNSNPPSQSSPQRKQSWLTTKVKSSPLLLSVFLSVARALGYGSPQQFANRRALHLYNSLCATRADQDSAFWREGVCSHCIRPVTGLINSQASMRSPANFPVLVYYHEPPCLAAHCPTSCPPCTRRKSAHSRAH
jgi:hypothetical protein